ncbi:anti-sigma factor [Actinacidiphila oryziradicis]|uniref:Zf-HC2 domain-containing protein n=1 Tax=Actinacidiphila oryziradicis TaxID=2571141 RepID=A0A4U0SNU4_9ACTN|nr:zf-HC2 domain-containing protein [Actinacidiphila oryziradicis]TKA11476.1 zf-HC2 domain-containing protein [Actinacidiphila oryziradicis]
MTPTTGTDEHPEVAEISALTEGILPPDRSADVRGHLDGCGPCADVRTSLDEIRGLLGTLPGPPRMPADIAGRIDAAIAAEALLDSTSSDPARPASAPPAVSRETAAEAAPGSVSRETAPSPGRPGGHAPATTGPGRARPRRRWGKRLLVTASVAAALGLGGVLVSSLSTGNNATSGASKSIAGAGTKAATDDLEARVHSLLAGATLTPELSPDLGAKETGRTSGSVPSCVLLATKRADAPLATGRDTYKGKSSYLVVLSHPGDATQVDAFVVDASCTNSPGTVLQHVTYPRQP